MKILGSQFLISGCDGSLFLDSLEEIFNVSAMFVVTSVKWPGIGSVGLRWNAAFQSAFRKKLPKFVRVVGFVGEYRPSRKAIDEIERTDKIMAIPGCSDQPKHAPGSIDQGMNLRVRSASRLANLLLFSALRTSESMFVNLHACGIDRPKFPFEPGSQVNVDLVPNPKIAPLSPSSVDRGVGSEDAEGAPTASLTKPKQDGMKDRFDWDWRSTNLSFAGLVLGTRLDQMNFFSSRATRRSSLWMRISGILNLTSP